MEGIDSAPSLCRYLYSSFSGGTNILSKSRRKNILTVPEDTPRNKIVFAQSLHLLSYDASQQMHQMDQRLSFGYPPYLLPHVDEEELPGNIEGHVGIIGIVAEVGDGDVYGDILHSPQSQIGGFLINAVMKNEQPLIP